MIRGAHSPFFLFMEHLQIIQSVYCQLYLYDPTKPEGLGKEFYQLHREQKMSGEDFRSGINSRMKRCDP